MDVSARKLEEYTLVRGMEGWHKHLKGGWGLPRRQIESQQYIRDEDGNILRDKELVSEIWGWVSSTILNSY